MFDYSVNNQDKFQQLGTLQSVAMETERLRNYGVYFHIHNVTKLL